MPGRSEICLPERTVCQNFLGQTGNAQAAKKSNVPAYVPREAETFYAGKLGKTPFFLSYCQNIVTFKGKAYSWNFWRLRRLRIGLETFGTGCTQAETFIAASSIFLLVFKFLNRLVILLLLSAYRRTLL